MARCKGPNISLYEKGGPCIGCPESSQALKLEVQHMLYLGTLCNKILSRYAQYVFNFQHFMSLAFAIEYCIFNVVQMSKFYLQLIALITFIIIIKLVQ